MTRESQVEKYLVWTVERMGGIAYKFQSVNHRGVSDRIVCLPDGSTWFIEVKATKGRLSPLQKIFALEMKRLNQKYACLWSQSEIDEWSNKVKDNEQDRVWGLP